jgi:hypothetical protein
MLRGFAPLCTQLLGNQGSWRSEVPHTSLRPPNAAPQSRNAQFIVFHPENHLVAHANPQRLANLGGNYDPAFFTDLTPSLKFHVYPPFMSDASMSQHHSL